MQARAVVIKRDESGNRLFVLHESVNKLCCSINPWLSRTDCQFLLILAYLQSVNKLMVFVYVDLHFLCLLEKIIVTAVNWPFYSSLLSCLAFEWKWGWRWPCFDRNLYALVMLMMLFQCKLVSIYIRKALRILSKQGYLQPYFHSCLLYTSPSPRDA